MMNTQTGKVKAATGENFAIVLETLVCMMVGVGVAFYYVSSS
jgi:hypothetical protein